MTETEPLYIEDEHQHSGLLEGKQTSLSYRKHKRAKQYQPTSIGVNNMAIPDSSLTRLEKYLNNIATGEGAIPDVPLTRIEQYLDCIAKNGGSGGGGSGGGGAVYATFTEDSGTWSCDKTYAELKAAYDAGSVIVGLAPRPGRTEIEAAAILIYNEAYNMFSAPMSFYSGFNSGSNSAHLRSWVMGIMSSGGVDTVFVEYHDGDIEVTNQS